MNFLPTYAQVNEKSEKERFCSQLNMEKIEEDEFLKDAFLFYVSSFPRR